MADVLEQVFTAFVGTAEQPIVTADILRNMVSARAGFVEALTPSQREMLAGLLGDFQTRMTLAVAGPRQAREQIGARRPDLVPVLATPEGSAWLLAELKALKALSAGRVV